MQPFLDFGRTNPILLKFQWWGESAVVTAGNSHSTKVDFEAPRKAKGR
jgi:hypothetical protein